MCLMMHLSYISRSILLCLNSWIHLDSNPISCRHCGEGGVGPGNRVLGLNWFGCEHQIASSPWVLYFLNPSWRPRSFQVSWRLKCTICIIEWKQINNRVNLSDWLMIAFITCNSSLGPLLEGLCSSNPCRFEFSIFWVVAGIEPTTSGLTVPRSDQLS